MELDGDRDWLPRKDHPPADVPGSTSTAGQLVASRPPQFPVVEEETLPLMPSAHRRTVALAVVAGLLALAFTLLALALWKSRSSKETDTPASTTTCSTWTRP